MCRVAWLKPCPDTNHERGDLELGSHAHSKALLSPSVSRGTAEAVPFVIAGKNRPAHRRVESRQNLGPRGQRPWSTCFPRSPDGAVIGPFSGHTPLWPKLETNFPENNYHCTTTTFSRGSSIAAGEGVFEALFGAGTFPDGEAISSSDAVIVSVGDSIDGRTVVLIGGHRPPMISAPSRS